MANLNTGTLALEHWTAGTLERWNARRAPIAALIARDHRRAPIAGTLDRTGSAGTQDGFVCGMQDGWVCGTLGHWCAGTLERGTLERWIMGTRPRVQGTSCFVDVGSAPHEYVVERGARAPCLGVVVAFVAAVQVLPCARAPANRRRVRVPPRARARCWRCPPSLSRSTESKPGGGRSTTFGRSAAPRPVRSPAGGGRSTTVGRSAAPRPHEVEVARQGREEDEAPPAAHRRGGGAGREAQSRSRTEERMKLRPTRACRGAGRGARSRRRRRPWSWAQRGAVVVRTSRTASE